MPSLVLNTLKSASEALAVAQALNKAVLRLYGEFVSEAGVDYRGMEGSAAFAEYVRATQGLCGCDLALLSGEEKKVFLLNLYNALVIHGTVALGVPRTPLETPGFFTDVQYQVGRHLLSLDDIEHGILRGNRPHPSGRVYFAEGDERRAWALAEAEVDPRVHFALVCGAKSCPPIRLFTAGNLERALRTAASSFLESTTSVDEPGGAITFSPILKWYGCDFFPAQGEDKGRTHLQGLVDRVSELITDDQLKQALARVRASPDGFKVEFSKYDWEVNEKS
jgi:hypothetical protein